MPFQSRGFECQHATPTLRFGSLSCSAAGGDGLIPAEKGANDDRDDNDAEVGQRCKLDPRL